MHFALIKLVLWPRRQELGPRIIDLRSGNVNVITGESQSGKSAILPIVDYCLASAKCSIPVGIIRDTTAWYGIVVQLEAAQLLLARRDPDDQQQTGDMFTTQTPRIDVPERIEKNANRETVLNYLNGLAGLPSLELDPDRTNPYAARPSFRDLVSLVFQPQWIVSNPNTLFFKTDTTQYREKLRALFPLVLEAIAPGDLAMYEELRDLRTLLKARKRELEGRQASATRWLGQIAALYVQAAELNLGQLDAPQPEWTAADYVGRLRRVEQEPNSEGLATADSIDAASLAVAEIDAREQLVSQALTSTRYRLEELRQLQSRALGYQRSLETQHGRVANSGWFIDVIGGDACPFCGSDNIRAHGDSRVAAALSKEIEESMAAVSRVPQMLDRELTSTRRELERLEESLATLRRQLAETSSSSETAEAERYSRDQGNRLIGRLGQSIQNWDESKADSALATEVADLESRVRELEETLDAGAKKRRQDEALKRISTLAQHYARIIGVESPDDRIELSVDDLNVRIVRESGRKDWLAEIGSGANWMGYHVSVMLALHEYFASRRRSHVPQLLVLDQPSQVYFPERWPADPDPKLQLPGLTEKQIEERVSDDLVRVHKVFEALQEGINRTNGALQVIVTDHADEITWRGLDSVALVARWRAQDPVAGRRLIPDEWMLAES